MEIIWFTLTAIVLYLAADRLLNFVEARRGDRFANRSVIFFFILAGMAIPAFALIQAILGGD